jgi:hypothetical protein
MSKLYIPACGDRITLIKPWQFTLYLEHRNTTFAKTVGLITDTGRWGVYHPGTNQLAHVKCTLEEGTILECDRVYIRSTSKSASTADNSYDSVSWKVVVNDKPARNQRFWVKLSDTSKLEYDPDSISKYRDRK